MPIKNEFKAFGDSQASRDIITNNIDSVTSYYKAQDVIHAYDHDLYNTQWSLVSCNALDILCAEYNSIIDESGNDLFGNQEQQENLGYGVIGTDFKYALKILFENYIISTINKYGLSNKILESSQYVELKSKDDYYDIEVGSIYEVICLTNTDVDVNRNPLYGIYGYRPTEEPGYYTNDNAIFNINNDESGEDTQKLDSRLYFKVDSVSPSGARDITVTYSIWSNILDRSRTYRLFDSSSSGVDGRLMTDARKRKKTTTITMGSIGSVGSNYKLVFSQYRGVLNKNTIDRLYIKKIG